MKVRILSGNQTGAVVEMEPNEAEHAIATGYGESAEPKADPGPVPDQTGEKPKPHPHFKNTARHK